MPTMPTTPMTLEGRSLLGTTLGATGGKKFTGFDPTTGDALPGEFHSASRAEVDVAARLASEAFATYGRWPGSKRAALLRRVAELLEAHAPGVVARAGLETALPAARLNGELARTCFQLRLYGTAVESGLAQGVRIDRGDPERKPLPKPDLRSMARPLGPVAVFGASNFPLAFSVAGGDTASALAAGCPVVVKAHPAHPGTSEMVGRLILRAARDVGAPEGVFSLLFDAGHEVGAALVTHPLIQAVGFTGSLRGGRALMDLAAARPRPIPVFAEMSSINPIFILDGALADKADELAAGLHGSVTQGVGQFCTKPGLVFVPTGADTDRFLVRLAALIAGTPPGTMLCAGILAAYRRGLATLADVPGVSRRAAVEAGPHRAAAALLVIDAETFLAESDHALTQEVFGPSTLVVECASPAQMLAAAMRLDGQLTATIHARPDELEAREDLVEVLAGKAGRVLFNGFPTGVEMAHAMTHGGPYPATSDGRSTSVGTRAVERFQRPVSYQNFPDAALPDELREANPLGIARLVDGRWQTEA